MTVLPNEAMEVPRCLRGKGINRLCHTYMISGARPAAPSAGREQLYASADGSYWLREEFYGPPETRSDTVMQMTADQARAWLKERSGWSDATIALDERLRDRPLIEYTLGDLAELHKHPELRMSPFELLRWAIKADPDEPTDRADWAAGVR